MGIVFGVPGVFGLLAGGLASGFVLAVFMANSGGAWDNAKKYIEQGHVGGKGSESHKAAVIGDTVGDPFKDTSGPSLNILIKLMSMVAIVTAGVNIAVTLFLAGNIFLRLTKGVRKIGGLPFSGWWESPTGWAASLWTLLSKVSQKTVPNRDWLRQAWFFYHIFICIRFYSGLYGE